MTEKIANVDQIDAGLQQVHGLGVAEHMAVDPIWDLVRGCTSLFAVFADNVGHAFLSEPTVLTVKKKEERYLQLPC